MDKETISSPSVHVPPTCWLSTPGPRDQEVTSLLASTSPKFAILGVDLSRAYAEPLTELDSGISGDGHQCLTVRTPPACCLIANAVGVVSLRMALLVLTIDPVWLSLAISLMVSPDAPS